MVNYVSSLAVADRLKHPLTQNIIVRINKAGFTVKMIFCAVEETEARILYETVKDLPSVHP